MNHLLLLDSSGFAHRAYHAMPVQRRESDGMPVHAIQGFIGLVWRLMNRAEADPFQYAAAVFDAPGPNFRHKLSPAYKAGRARWNDLDEQLPLLREVARSMGIEPIECAGWEADDVIATLAARAKKEGIRTTVVAVDKDMLQLIEDGVIEVVDPVQRVRILEADVAKKFGVEPRQMIDLQALAGDSVDNIPGVPGLGLKTAAGLIRRFGSLKELMKAVDDKHETMAARVRSSLKKERKNIPIYRKLATLRTDVPWPGSIISDLKPKPVREVHLRDMLRAVGIESAYGRLFGERAQLVRVVPRIENPFEWWEEELAAKGQNIPEVPQCGYYERRLAHGTNPVAARIWREPELDFLTHLPNGQDLLMCEVNGKRRDAYNEWGFLCMRPVSQKRFTELGGASQAAAASAPTDFTKLPAPTFGRKRS